MVCFIMVACHTVLLASIVTAVDWSHRRRERKRGVKMESDHPMCSRQTNCPSGDSPEAWRLECERLALYAGLLLRLADRHASYAGMVEIIREAPRSKEEAENPGNTSLFIRVLKDAVQLRPFEDRTFKSIKTYFLEYLPTMDKDRRARLEACVIGTLLGTGMA